MVPPREKLVELLLDMCTDSEFERFVALNYGKVRNYLPVPGSHSYQSLMAKTVEVLQERRVIDREFFLALIALRPMRREEIEAVAKAWKIDLSPPQAAPAPPTAEEVRTPLAAAQRLTRSRKVRRARFIREVVVPNFCFLVFILGFTYHEDIARAFDDAWNRAAASAIAAHVQSVEAYNYHRQDEYYDSYTESVDCFYGDRDVSMRELRPELDRINSVDIRDLRLEYFASSLTEIVLCEKGETSPRRPSKGETRMYNKTVVMRLTDVGWKIATEFDEPGQCPQRSCQAYQADRVPVGM